MRSKPVTARELRRRCAGWPDRVVRRAVLTACEDVRVNDPIRANFIASWLMEPRIPEEMLENPPGLTPDLINAISRHLDRSAH